MLFALNVTERHGWIVVRVVGDVDLATVPQFRHRLARIAASGPVALALDLTGVDHLDSLGLGVIVGTLKRVRDGGGQLRVVAGAPVRALFERTCLDRIIPVGDELPPVGGESVPVPAVAGPSGDPPSTRPSGDRRA